MLLNYKYTTYDFNTSESKILRHLNAFAYTPGLTKGYHGNLTLHVDIVCDTKEEAMAMLDSMVEYELDDHGILYLERGRKHWIVRSSWR